MNQQKQLVVPSRRLFMGYSATTLSAGAIALLGGNEVLAAESKMDIESDINILNIAVGLEYEGINAYTIALKSGLLSKAHSELAKHFQEDHKAHNAALIATIEKLGGKPAEQLTLDQYAKNLKVSELKNEKDVLALAARLELDATNAYLGVITAFKDPALGKIAARLAADEATHYSLLNFDLKRPLPGAMSFGA